MRLVHVDTIVLLSAWPMWRYTSCLCSWTTACPSNKHTLVAVSPAQTIAIPMAIVKAAKVLTKTMKVTLDLATTLMRATMEKLRRAMHFAACCNTCAAATGSGSYNRFCGAWTPFAEWALRHKGLSDNDTTKYFCCCGSYWMAAQNFSNMCCKGDTRLAFCCLFYISCAAVFSITVNVVILHWSAASSSEYNNISLNILIYLFLD